MSRFDRTADVDALFRAARTDPDAFVELYRFYAPAVYRWFRARAGADPETAADLTAEVFARAIVGIRRFRGRRPDAGTAWLFAIARHLAVDYARHREVDRRARARLRMSLDAYEPSHEEDVVLRVQTEASSARVLEAFERLSEPQQETLRWRIVDELGYGEIAARSGSTEQAARLQVMRGLRRLRQLVAPTEGGT